MARASIACVAVILLLSQNVSTWHAKGHMAVAAVAYELLSEPAKDRVAELLILNPTSSQWDQRLATAPKQQRRKLRFLL